LKEVALGGELALEEAVDLSCKKMDELANVCQCPEVMALVFQLHNFARLQYCIIDSWVFPSGVFFVSNFVKNRSSDKT